MNRSLHERLAIEIPEAGIEELGLFCLGSSSILKWLPEAEFDSPNFCSLRSTHLKKNVSGMDFEGCVAHA